MRWPGLDRSGSATRSEINTILTHPSIADPINLYWKRYGGKIQFLADCGWMECDFQILEGANIALETLAATRQRPRRWSV